MSAAGRGNGNGRTPDQIRRDIEHTREELAETAAQLAVKADVKARAHDKVEETKARLHDKVDEAKAKVTGTAATAKDKASDATPDSVAHGAHQAAGTVQHKGQDNPVVVAIVAGFATGALIGWLVASRRRR
jgi:ElaB/YqjD/DUF883 family membrane-anchored ribosome-binding protein